MSELAFPLLCPGGSGPQRASGSPCRCVLAERDALRKTLGAIQMVRDLADHALLGQAGSGDQP